MKILFDCSNLKTGGALQNGLSFLKMSRNDKKHTWYVAVSEELGTQVPSSWDNDFAFFKRFPPRKTVFDFAMISKDMRKIDSDFNPDIVFSMFGPSYWKSKKVHVSGFAIPYFLYPDVDIFYTTKGFQRTKLLLKHFLLLKLKKYFFCKSDYLVAETDTVKKRAASYLGFPENRIFVAHNSFSPIFKDEMQKASNQKVSYASEENDIFRLLIPSAWYWHKNLEIIAELSNRIANYKLIIEPLILIEIIQFFREKKELSICFWIATSVFFSYVITGPANSFFNSKGISVLWTPIWNLIIL